MKNMKMNNINYKKLKKFTIKTETYNKADKLCFSAKSINSNKLNKLCLNKNKRSAKNCKTLYKT